MKEHHSVVERRIVAIGGDDAGAKAAWSFWPEIYNKVRRWPGDIQRY